MARAQHTSHVLSSNLLRLVEQQTVVSLPWLGSLRSMRFQLPFANLSITVKCPRYVAPRFSQVGRHTVRYVTVWLQSHTADHKFACITYTTTSSSHSCSSALQVLRAAEEYGVPRSTLQDKVAGRSVLSAEWTGTPNCQ